MKKTESDFGLLNIDGKISADNGQTTLPKYSEMSSKTFDELRADIEDLKEEKLSLEDIEDLKEILN